MIIYKQVNIAIVTSNYHAVIISSFGVDSIICERIINKLILILRIELSAVQMFLAIFVAVFNH